MAGSSEKSERREFLPFFKPTIGEEEIAAVSEVLRSGWLTYGPKVREFGQACADFLRVPFAVPVASASAGLFLSLKAMGVGPGDEVVLPALTFNSTLTAILQCGATPVVVDLEDSTLGLDPAALARVLNDRTRAVIPVHMAGHPCRIQVIHDLVRPLGVKVVEDAAHAFGAEIDGQRLGALSDATVFSFYATKCITTGDGGLVTTADAELAASIQLLSLHGMDGDAWKRYSEKGSWYYEIVRSGYKMNLGDPAAALGLVQLNKCEALQARRTEIASCFNVGLAPLPGLILPHAEPWATHAWHLYILRVDPTIIAGGRDGLIADLTAAKIGSSVHFIPLHHHPAYQELLAPWAKRLPATDQYFASTVSLPLFPTMTDRDVEDVVAAVTASVGSRAR